MSIHFPPLTAEMQAHSEALVEHIRQEIELAGGHISFSRFMQLALYTPGLGYYSSGSPKLGKMGDFITAPEVSPLFAQCIARQFAEILPHTPQSDILELGAGSGNFTKEVLLELEKNAALPGHYYILEISADLRARQQTLLKQHCPRFYPRIIWLNQLPETFSGIIFANEVIDALPVHCFRIEENAVKERCVTFKDQQFAWKITPPLSDELRTAILPLMQEYQLRDGYESEINLLAPKWIKTLGQILQRGIILFFDYGYGRREYYHADRSTGTLSCYYQHRCHYDPFLFVGLQDITAHVDFTYLVENAVAADLHLAGYTTQSSFLLACGIMDFASAPPFTMKQYQQSQAMKMLMLPTEMGSLIKAVAFSKHWDAPLLGFSLFDKKREL